MKESHSMKHKSNLPYLMKDTNLLHNCRRIGSRPTSQWPQPNLLPPVMKVHYNGNKKGHKVSLKSQHADSAVLTMLMACSMTLITNQVNIAV